jgi:hypothetical protein
MLNNATQKIWDKANAMLSQNILDSLSASLLQKTLRQLADKAHDFGRGDQVIKFRQLADDLAARFLPPATMHP